MPFSLRKAPLAGRVPLLELSWLGLADHAAVRLGLLDDASTFLQVVLKLFRLLGWVHRVGLRSYPLVIHLLDVLGHPQHLGHPLQRRVNHRSQYSSKMGLSALLPHAEGLGEHLSG